MSGAQNHIFRGKRGEEVAERYLKLRLYRILEQNWRCKFGELDICAAKGSRLVLVEVKTRHEALADQIFDSITWSKRKRLALLAEIYRKSRPFKTVRIDAVGVVYNEQNVYRVLKHIKGISP